MKRMALAVTGLLCAGQAFAQSAEALDLRVPEQPNPYTTAEASPPRDPPGTYYGDTSGRPSTRKDADAEAADDGKAKVWGSFTTGIGHTKGYGTSHYNAAEVNVSKSFGDGERPNNVNLQIRVEQGDGPAFGRGPYPYFGPDHFGRDPYYPPPR
ncbi:MAG TPA: hypothetical protein VET30_03505 [Pseudoxanthomonas sp.]|nr:hypothetical protein [Pseudoxanthomonas sp.]